LSVYGIGKDRTVETWRLIARSLLHQRLMAQSDDGYAVLSLNEASRAVLRGERRFQVAKAEQSRRRTAQPPPSSANAATANGSGRDSAAAAGADTPGNGVLFERLRALRKHLADAQGLPPYVIFHDATLREMAALRPQTLDEFAAIRGVGAGKLQRYGAQFIAALRDAIP
jgi:ATP-dependent DNA helicase RecQ